MDELDRTEVRCGIAGVLIIRIRQAHAAAGTAHWTKVQYPSVQGAL